MSVPAGLFLSLALVAAGFSLLRLSLRGAWQEVFAGSTGDARLPARLGAIALLVLSPVPWLAVAAGAVVGWMAWLFCILPLGGLPLIAMWPFERRMALVAPPLLLAIFATFSGLP
jgi:hypothetical protein